MKWYQLTPSKPMFDQLAQVQRNAAYFMVPLLAALTSIHCMKAKMGFSEPIKTFAENKAFH